MRPRRILHSQQWRTKDCRGNVVCDPMIYGNFYPLNVYYHHCEFGNTMYMKNRRESVCLTMYVESALINEECIAIIFFFPKCTKDDPSSVYWYSKYTSVNGSDPWTSCETFRVFVNLDIILLRIVPRSTKQTGRDTSTPLVCQVMCFVTIVELSCDQSTLKSPLHCFSLSLYC